MLLLSLLASGPGAVAAVDAVPECVICWRRRPCAPEGRGGEGVVRPLGEPLSCGLLFCFAMRLPGAARPFSCLLSCVLPPFLFVFATM